MKQGKANLYATLRLSEAMSSEPPGREEGSPVSAVQLLRAGTFEHGWYGKIRIDSDLYDTLIRNFDERVRGVDIALDVEHQPEQGAAGWFRRLTTDENGETLWGEVEWTPKGRALVEGREFKYLSMEYDLAYVDEDGVLRGPTMLGAALTNRPFIKRMREATVKFGEYEEPEEEMTEVALSEGEEALLREVTRLREENRQVSAALSRERLAGRLAEAKREGRVTPAMEGWLRELAESDSARFDRVLGSLPVVVPFGEVGTSAAGSDNGDPVAALDATVRAKIREIEATSARDGGVPRTVSYGEALALVQAERPGLVSAYQAATRRR
jgi:phage I-like protein